MKRKIAEPVKKMANIVIDTSHLNTPKLQETLERYFAIGQKAPFRISFVSFGYKHGIPRDADLLFDVRFLPKPLLCGSIAQFDRQTIRQCMIMLLINQKLRNSFLV